MNEVFKPYMRKFILVFFDDILVYNPDGITYEASPTYSRDTPKNQLFAKLSKCSFGQDKLEYLGHIISGEGVSADPLKVDCMTRCTTPTSIKDLRRFLGLTGYYRRFFKNYGLIAKPLTDLLKKNNLHWDNSSQVAFEKLKKVVSSTPV
ncbi:uncharacterized protein LOC113305875 [Papaver somniferum]|uniref:uncharacterized protein LOC113305875 n=1 Tax=Papaver somniferum TaxID=3469 RepID=UPI000E6F65A6|nr:uncharacterized protein LOC113305875 [Papaver somniferum]